MQKKKGSPPPFQSESELETPFSVSDVSALQPEQKETAPAPEPQPEVLAPGPESQPPDLAVPKPELQSEGVAQEPEKPTDAPALVPDASPPEPEASAPGSGIPPSPNGISLKPAPQPLPQSDGTAALSEEDSASIARSTRGQCSKRGRGRPPLTATQRAQRMATQQLPGKTPDEAWGVPQQPGGVVPEEASAHKATFLKNIRQFIMPVVSARSSRLIRTPRRFMDEIPQKSTRSTESPAVEGPCPDKQETSLLSLPAAPLQLPPPGPSSPVKDTSRTLSPPPSPGVPPVPSSVPALSEKRRSILREPTFRWTSLSPTSSPKDMGKTLFHLPCEDASSLPSTPAPTPSPPTPKRTPLLRAPQFTPSEAHLKIYESLTVSPEDSELVLASSEIRRDPPAPQQEAPALPFEPVVTRSGRKLWGRTNHLALPLFTEVPRPLGVQGKELITMEDVNSPGVVHKVAIRRVVPPSVQEEAADSSESEVEPASPCSEELRPPLEEPKPITVHLSNMDKVYSLLTRAKVQLFKIDQQKQFKLSPVSEALTRTGRKTWA